MTFHEHTDIGIRAQKNDFVLFCNICRKNLGSDFVYNIVSNKDGVVIQKKLYKKSTGNDIECDFIKNNQQQVSFIP